MEKVSIVVPVYDTERYLRRCLDSLIRQTYDNLEILVVNDGSPDNSIEIIREFERLDSRIIVFDIENRGVSQARNLGIRHGTGKYVWFVDSDDFLYEDAVEKMVEAIGDCELAVCNLNSVADGKPDQVFLTLPPNPQIAVTEAFIGDLLGERVHLGGSLVNKLYRLDVLRESGLLFEERSAIYAEDAMFGMKALRYIRRIAVLDLPLYGYYQRSESVSHQYKKELAVRCEGFIRALDAYYEGKYRKELKRRSFVFFLEILYNERPNGFQRFAQILRTPFFQEQLEEMDLSGLSRLRILVWKLRKHPVILYTLFKLSGREA